jgi:hypothetical protein
MIYSETEHIVDQSLNFPVTHLAMEEQGGSIEIQAQSGASVTISEVLDDIGEERYATSKAL